MTNPVASSPLLSAYVLAYPSNIFRQLRKSAYSDTGVDSRFSGAVCICTASADSGSVWVATIDSELVCSTWSVCISVCRLDPVSKSVCTVESGCMSACASYSKPESICVARLLSPSVSVSDSDSTSTCNWLPSSSIPAYPLSDPSGCSSAANTVIGDSTFSAITSTKNAERPLQHFLLFIPTPPSSFFYIK